MFEDLPEKTKAQRAFKKMVIQMRTQNRPLEELLSKYRNSQADNKYENSSNLPSEETT